MNGLATSHPKHGIAPEDNELGWRISLGKLAATAAKVR